MDFIVRGGSSPLLPTINPHCGRLAQLVRASGLHPEGHRFDSYSAHHLEKSRPTHVGFYFCNAATATRRRTVGSMLSRNERRGKASFDMSE